MTPEQGEHTRLPADHRVFRAPFLASTIPQPTDADRAHDAYVDQLTARFAAARRAMARTDDTVGGA